MSIYFKSGADKRRYLDLVKTILAILVLPKATVDQRRDVAAWVSAMEDDPDCINVQVSVETGRELRQTKITITSQFVSFDRTQEPLQS